MKTSIAGMLMAAALVASASSSAGTIWTFTNGAYSPVGVYDGVGGAGTHTNTLAGTAAVGWANTVGSNANPGGVAPNLQTLASGGLTNQGGSGFGLTNADACTSNVGSNCDLGDGTSPEHAVDNSDRNEMALLSFQSAVKLSKVTIGWAGADSDITVLAYVGSGAPTLTNKTWSNLAADASWIKIGNYANLAASGGSGSATINGGGVYSSYWLIGADNALANPSGTRDGNLDYVKIQSVTGCIAGTSGCNPPTPPSSVPEPGSIVLFGLALAGLGIMRKRGKQIAG